MSLLIRERERERWGPFLLMIKNKYKTGRNCKKNTKEKKRERKEKK